MTILFRSGRDGAPSRSGCATVGDQVIVAVTNFVLTLVIGRVFSAEEFASYGIGLSIGLMLQGLQRHAVTIPLMLEPDARVRRRASAFSAAQSALLACAVLVAAVDACDPVVRGDAGASGILS